MAFSKTYIANRALSKLGEGRVSNVDTDDIKKAKIIRYMWESVRDSLLQSFPWTFAIDRKSLLADATAPEYGWNYRYVLPTDFLSLVSIKDSPKFRVEGGYILTDEASPLKIQYVKTITDTGKYDAMFVEALATKLAFEACEEITQSNTKKQLLAEELRQNIKDAYANNSIQTDPIEVPEDEWISSRENSIYDDDIDYNS